MSTRTPALALLNRPATQDVHGTAAGTSLEGMLADLEAAADGLIGVAGPDALDAADAGGAGGITMSRLVEAGTRVRAVVGRLEALRLSFLPRIEADGRWGVGPGSAARTFATWHAMTANISPATARREVATARILEQDLRATRAAALAGRIGPDHLTALVQGAPTSPARRTALAAFLPSRDVDASPGAVEEPESTEHPDSPDRQGPPTGEEYLLAQARIYRPAQFRRLVARFAQVADPDADDRGYLHARDREHVELSKTFGGYHLSGFLTDEHGLTLTTALNSVMGPPTPGAGRTTTQRRAQGLADLARIVLDNGHTGTGAAVRPHLTVTVSWTEFQTLAVRAGATQSEIAAIATPAKPTTRTPTTTRTTTGTGGTATGTTATGGAVFTETGILVPPALLAKIACDSQVTRVVFGPESQVLDVGRAQRTVTGQLRRAVIARDQHCTWPGCDEPPSRCEVHHAEHHWADGGSTSVANSALLCWHHHDHVDAHRITMTRTGDRWAFAGRHGEANAPPDIGS